MVEHNALNLVVMGSSPMVSDFNIKMYNYIHIHDQNAYLICKSASLFILL